MLTAGELKLAAYFLHMAADEFSNHGCNDMPKEALEASGFDSVASRRFSEDCAAYIGRETYERGFMAMQDDTAMHYLAFKLQFYAEQNDD